MEWTFTEEDWHAMHKIQAISFGKALDDDMVSLWISKLLDNPLQALKYKAERLIDPKSKTQRIDVLDELKLFM